MTDEVRLIDANALKETLKDLCSASNNVMQRQIENSMLHGIMPKVIDDEPTVDAELVKQGKWMGTVCTACGESDSLYFNHDFCPNCGARMDGGVEDETD